MQKWDNTLEILVRKTDKMSDKAISSQLSAISSQKTAIGSFARIGIGHINASILLI